MRGTPENVGKLFQKAMRWIDKGGTGTELAVNIMKSMSEVYEADEETEPEVKMVTKLRMNRVAHYYGGRSDKVYIASVREVSPGEFIVVGKYGRRGSWMKEHIKPGEYSDVNVAVAEAEALFRSKTEKGYVDIDSPNYDGPVTYHDVREHLEPELGDCKVMKKKVAKKGAKKVGVYGHPGIGKTSTVKKKPVEENFVVKCTNNDGMEDCFDLNVTYIARRHKVDSEMFLVTDKLGQERECFNDRFEITDDEE